MRIEIVCQRPSNFNGRFVLYENVVGIAEDGEQALKQLAAFKRVADFGEHHYARIVKEAQREQA